MNEAKKAKADELVKLHESRAKQLDSLREKFDEWSMRNKKQNQNANLLTSDQIKKIHGAARKKFEGQAISGAERTAKKEVVASIKNAFNDTVSLISLDLADPMSNWRKVENDGIPVKGMLISSDEWTRMVPINSLVKLVRAMVKLRGEEYALPVANAVRLGLKDQAIGWSNYEVDVPILKRIIQE